MTKAAANTNVEANNTQADAAPAKNNVTELVPTTKIERAKKFYEEISADGFEVPEGSSPRKEFISRCVSDLGMTEHGASTYWQNLRKEVETGTRYPHAKPATGAPRGRRVDQAGRIKKAAAKVQKERERVNAAMASLNEAESELVELSTGLVESQQAS